MRKNISAIFAFGTATALLLACNKPLEYKANPDGAGNAAFVRIVHAAPSFRTVFSNRDSFNVYVGSNKANSTFLTYAAVFPAAGTNNYLAFPEGNQLFRFSVHGSINNPDSVNLYSFIKQLQPNTRYSLIITDSIKSTNENKQMWLLDNFAEPIPSQFGIRFVHAVMNDTAGKLVDLYSVKNKANLFSNVPIGSATGFLNYPTTLSNDTLIVRRPGITTWELARANSVLYGSQRVYTFIYRGDTRATGTKGKALTSYTNL